MARRPFYFESINMLRFALRDGLITYRGIVERCIEQYEKWEDRVGAWVVFDRVGALKQADVLDREREKGGELPRLHGIPIGVKDIIDVEGMPTSAGVNRWATGRAKQDAPMIARLRKDGAIILGKTVTTPYAWVDPPPTRNPWDQTRTPGGSSSGSAAAVATGMAIAAIGTQTGGSIIRPASFCGVVGWKPSFPRRASTAGIVPFAASLDTPGWFCRDVTDVLSLQPATGGPLSGAREPIWTMHRVEKYLSSQRGGQGFDLDIQQENTEELEANPGVRMAPRMGHLRGFFEERADVEMLGTIEAAVERWREEGADIVEVKFPTTFSKIHKAHRVVMAYEAAKVHATRFFEVPDDYPPRIRELLEEGFAHTETEYREALEAGRAFANFVRPDLDALVMPAAAGPAPGPETTGEPAFNSPWTFGGQPVITFPVGLSKDGLPLGVQLVGREGGDADLLGAAEWCRWDRLSRAVLPNEF